MQDSTNAIPAHVQKLIATFHATHDSRDTPVTLLGCRSWSGFDHESELDGFADGLIWDSALEQQRHYDQISREATYYWAVRARNLVITYTEGDVTIILAPCDDVAAQAFELVDPVAITERINGAAS